MSISDEDLRRTESNLQILSIFYYVLGGIGCFFALFALIYVFVGFAILNGEQIVPDHDGTAGPPKEFLGWFFIGFGGIFFVLGELMGLLTIMAGRWITHRRKRIFTMVLAGIHCLNIPFGTALGVFTFIMLGGDKGRWLYEHAARGRSGLDEAGRFDH